MDFRILGSLEVEDRGQSLPLGGHQQRALLALLLLRANDVVPVDEIIEHLWGPESPPSATKSVHALISKLRRRLENDPAGVDPGQNGVLLTRPHGYVLTVSSGELDLHRFQSLLDEGQQALSAGRADEAAADASSPGAQTTSSTSRALVRARPGGLPKFSAIRARSIADVRATLTWLPRATPTGGGTNK